MMFPIVLLTWSRIQMAISLFEHQKDAIEKLGSGSILCGGVGSGKSRTAIAYYFLKECEGKMKINGSGGYAPMKNPKDLYIITTARKRDTLEWEQECCPFLLSTDSEVTSGADVVVDSWNNIQKYKNVKNAFFIFDEQRVVGSGVWVSSFLKIVQNNKWILLTATPGDSWLDYIPVFIANGFYKNRTEFIKRHVVYSSFSKYPKVDRYIEVGRLIRLRNQTTVNMHFQKQTTAHDKTIITDFDKVKFNIAMVNRWNPYEEKPIRDISELCYIMRRIVNSDASRKSAIIELLSLHPKIIVFYNFNYELNILTELAKEPSFTYSQWNGHKHEQIPSSESWLYFVQYFAGAEAWNCIETNCIVFYSQSYSYKTMIQAAGRIDRLNTPYSDLYYYYLRSNSIIDMAIQKALVNKRNFNEHRFLNI